MTCYVFPGQGSQKVGMGEELFNQFPEYVKKSNNILGYDIKKLCLEDPENKLGKTNYTQPALYIVSALAYLNQKSNQESSPSYLAGHSLGEYTALFAAKSFDFETGLKLVQKRGDLMSKASGGGMAAIIGLNKEDINDVIQNNNLNSIQIANLNEPNQTVISGEKESILSSQKIFEEAGAKRYIPLAVSGAFHSKFMDNAKNEFKEFLETVDIKRPSLPVIANVTARPIEDNVKELLIQQIVSSVRWVETIEYVLQQNETNFEEIGPGKVLSGLIAKIKRSKLVNH